MDDRWTLPSLAFDLEHPNFVILPGPDSERKDSLNSSGAFSLSPLHDSTHEKPLPEPAATPSPSTLPDTQAIQRLKKLRKSPGFKLIADSVLLLKTLQLDMDYPPPQRVYIHEQLTSLLRQKTGKELNPDHLHITFNTESRPSVDEHGRERYSARLSLTELALTICDITRLTDLLSCTITNAPLTPDMPTLTSRAVFELIINARWGDDYSDRVNRFWREHQTTYRSLARLSFLDVLARKFARKKISRNGYYLTLDALGFKHFPADSKALEQTTRGDSSEVRMLSLNGQLVPGIFQVRSLNTSHCFIHVLGDAATITEYISDEPRQMSQRLLDTLNASRQHRLWLGQYITSESVALVVESVVIQDDVFSRLTDAQKTLALDLLESMDGIHDIDPLKPIARGLTLAGAVDLWQTQASILGQIPAPLKISAQLMAEVIRTLHGTELNPDHVFIAYRRGHSTTPLGSILRPTVHVHVPDEKPVSLSQALMSNYRVQYPAGYIDHGGRSVVYLDPTGKGVWSADQELAISALDIEEKIKAIDFLHLMSQRLDEFWEQQAQKIEQMFQAMLISQAVICLKQGCLLRSGFDSIVKSLTDPAAQWLTLGFEVQNSFVEGIEHQYCAGLLVLEKPDKPQRVLYQAGLPKAFIEFKNDEALQEYLRHATGDEKWRTAVLNYVPVRNQERLNYLFRLWAGVQAQDPPASILRPWTDVIYNPDVRKALNHSLHRYLLPGSPFAFMRQTLKQNTLEEAQQQIVTSTQVSLRYWSQLLSHLQWVLAPMSFVLTPAFIAVLAIDIGITSLNVVAANQPGSGREEKKQAILSALSLGLFSLLPFTPRLLGALKRIVTPVKSIVRTQRATALRPLSTASLFGRSMQPRQTRLEKFFHTDSMLKVWTVPGHPLYGNLPIHAWKLGRKFLLWTSSKGQARTLVVSTHGQYLPWSSTVKIPNGTEIHTYAPHGYLLADPKLHRVVSKKVGPFAISNDVGNTLAIPPSSLPSLVVTDKLMAGTSVRGRLKNYTLSKFQTVADETYQDIANIVRNSNISPFKGQLPSTPMDILTVRNRFAMSAPALEDLFKTLWAQGIHYDRILLVHCRCSAIDAFLRRSPVYLVPAIINAP
ncbi:dermonecrotic toxin domain-containing protein [Pseudomonas cichorii]|uniref:dermonecrotic toxin domain-containing protein n=1 Tax=Pseudomonas cichorii TaxID=36746 RepID=UPI001C890837|nr:DUF6543 domain-containing protein [Pseudomonas cichorii]MBX8484560.1 hypothetical protein [Pseudomonas cichorii]